MAKLQHANEDEADLRDTFNVLRFSCVLALSSLLGCAVLHRSEEEGRVGLPGPYERTHNITF